MLSRELSANDGYWRGPGVLGTLKLVTPRTKPPHTSEPQSLTSTGKVRQDTIVQRYGNDLQGVFWTWFCLGATPSDAGDQARASHAQSTLQHLGPIFLTQDLQANAFIYFIWFGGQTPGCSRVPPGSVLRDPSWWGSGIPMGYQGLNSGQLPSKTKAPFLPTMLSSRPQDLQVK